MATKSTDICYNLKSGKKVTIKIIREQGYKNSIIDLDGDKCGSREYIDDFEIYITIEGMPINNREVAHMPYWSGRHNAYVFGLGEINNSMVYLALPTDIYNRVIELIREDIAATNRTSKKIKTEEMVEKGQVLPEAELEAKKKEYDDLYNEGGEGYNPYDYYMIKEDVNKTLNHKTDMKRIIDKESLVEKVLRSDFAYIYGAGFMCANDDDIRESIANVIATDGKMVYALEPEEVEEEARELVDEVANGCTVYLITNYNEEPLYIAL